MQMWENVNICEEKKLKFLKFYFSHIKKYKSYSFILGAVPNAMESSILLYL